MKKQNNTTEPAISSNGVLPAIIAPIDARNEKDRLRLREDNTATENYWLLLNDGHVTLVQPTKRTGKSVVGANTKKRMG